MPPDRPKPGEIYFELVPAGAFVRATAIDPTTGIEATIVGPASAGPAALQQAALAKLNYIIRRNKASAAPRK